MYRCVCVSVNVRGLVCECMGFSKCNEEDVKM